jgi:hypothetical protein
MPIARLVHADRTDAETEKAGVEPRELRLNRREIQKIVVQDFAQFWVCLSGRAAPDHQHAGHVGIEQTFAQDALPDHSGSAEQNDFHPIFQLWLVSWRVQAAAATESNDTPVSVAETSHNRAAAAASFACAMIFAGAGGPFNS